MNDAMKLDDLMCFQGKALIERIEAAGFTITGGRAQRPGGKAYLLCTDGTMAWWPRKAELRHHVQTWIRCSDDERLACTDRTVEALCLDLGLEEVDYGCLVHPDLGIVNVVIEKGEVVDERRHRVEMRNQFLEELGEVYDVPAPLPEPEWNLGKFVAKWTMDHRRHHLAQLVPRASTRALIDALLRTCSPEDWKEIFARVAFG